jgi:lipoprotein-anchoring transpeptidase ErfK/SrfK
MEFIGGGYFIHDAPWRSWYGPGANLYNGTHGCVNVPYGPMATLWSWAPIGTTVVVQY